MSKKKNVCYWCGKEASTREHVPPRSFFPDVIESDGSKMNRSKLITVRSCEQHNTQKGNFDEYLRNRIVAAAHNQSALSNTPSTLKSLFRTGELQRAIQETEQQIELTAYDCNVGYALESISRALYYHEFGNCFDGVCRIYFGAYQGENNIVKCNKEIIDYYLHESTTWNTSIKGHYPDVFTYQFSHTGNDGITILLMCFYESVYAVSAFCDQSHESELHKIPIEEAVIKVRQLGLDPIKLLFPGIGYNNTENEDKGEFIRD